ncbi:DUF445 domain-containing protein [Bordetella genomosp. 9]|uniref:DUF445 domain-containing protein n=2 Tax=Bordetella genomosp. 9 TaxID=1416803 RepID=A0A1W6Z5R3_9BORD|nr:DUF445 domain-containing protein [Bordetella genomosp. 9]ARP92485.1 DUF445 domain-containing protein [Bordetella genomosp. 9]
MRGRPPQILNPPKIFGILIALPGAPLLPDDPRRTALRRMKTWALASLAATLAGVALSYAMGGQGVWAWVRAFCEAATVGALADWFAVVALFRRPLGLPIPHTAIIPSNKARIADNLAAFVRDHFLDSASLLERLRVFDPAARLGQWLSDPRQARVVAATARTWVLHALDLLDEQAVRDGIQRFVVARLREWNAARTAGDLFDLLARDGRHHAILDEALNRLAGYLNGEPVRARASALMVKYARKEWPRMAKALNMVKPVDDIADSLADRLARAMLDELRDVLAQPDHPLRRDYEAWIAGYVARLREDPELQRQVEALKERIIAHEQVGAYVQGIWDEVRASLRRDLFSDESALGRHLEQTLLALGRNLGQDPALRDAINQHVLTGADRLAAGLRQGITAHISQTVRNWDEREFVDELELSIGRDLQYIRFNGMVVGGLIGLALHACVRAAELAGMFAPA